ncbi:MAG: Hsp20/alpha crystallin family protein [Methanomicrobiales archaeon]
MTTIIRKPRKKKIVIDPPTRISENGGSICIISQLHGISEDDIRIDLENRRLEISASLPDAMVMRVVLVPEGSRIIRKKFRDGILEIILEKPQ